MASSSSSLTSAAPASKAGRKPGRMKPPSLLAANPTPLSLAASMSAAVDVLVCWMPHAGRRDQVGGPLG